MTATPPADGLSRFVPSALALLRAGGGAVRDLWLMGSQTLCLFLGFEGPSQSL